MAFRAFRDVDPATATLEVWGDPAASPVYRAALAALASPAVRLAGRFDEERRSEIFAGLDVLIVPSLGLESFGLAAREALAEGVPVLAARRGALAELFDGQAEPCGALFNPEDPEELRGWVERLVQRPEILAAWAANPPRIKEMDEHAEEIERVYEQILATRRGAA
jgi:glycosyltransferase involved in cell wall biosynthesis